MKYFKSTVKLITLLIFTLNSTQVCFAAPPEKPPSSEIKSLFQQFPSALASDTDAKQNLLRINHAIQAYEEGRALGGPEEKYDVFHLTPQRLELPKSAVVNLAEITTDALVIPFSTLKIEYSVSKKELSFVASRGENDLGEHGTVVAKHIISKLDIAGFTHDNEMLSMIDHKGNLSVIDMGYVATELGRNPIPVFKNIWKAPEGLDLHNKNIKVHYITRGTPPPPASIFEDSRVVIPRNAEGIPIFKAGDLIVTYDENGISKYLGIFSRQVSHSQIVRGSQLLEIQATLADPEYSKVEQLRKLFEEFDLYSELNEEQYKSDRMNLEVRAALMSILPRQIKALNSRRADHNQYIQKPTDVFTLSEWE
ncbi:MAG TPA: hypothetical protein PLJ21_06830, partial [Pseudobdellovibrionaceae bacterium]|nr:hypothetical protein [Pseudobdellovibrionaceae bacterium]